jgi:hypothetical protein
MRELQEAGSPSLGKNLRILETTFCSTMVSASAPQGQAHVVGIEGAREKRSRKERPAIQVTLINRNLSRYMGSRKSRSLWPTHLHKFLLNWGPTM